MSLDRLTLSEARRMREAGKAKATGFGVQSGKILRVLGASAGPIDQDIAVAEAAAPSLRQIVRGPVTTNT